MKDTIGNEELNKLKFSRKQNQKHTFQPTKSKIGQKIKQCRFCGEKHALKKKNVSHEESFDNFVMVEITSK